jgi:hypothetical protein
MESRELTNRHGLMDKALWSRSTIGFIALPELVEKFHEALSHKPMASGTVPVTVLPPVSVR